MPSVSVTIVNSSTNNSVAEENFNFQINEKEIIYDGLDRQGHKLPAGCLAGSCGTCRINVISGIENCETAGLVEQDTISHITKEYLEKHGANSLDGKNLRLACRTKVTGAVTIKTFKS
jgi:ferredoxin